MAWRAAKAALFPALHLAINSGLEFFAIFLLRLCSACSAANSGWACLARNPALRYPSRFIGDGLVRIVRKPMQKGERLGLRPRQRLVDLAHIIGRVTHNGAPRSGWLDTSAGIVEQHCSLLKYFVANAKVLQLLHLHQSHSAVSGSCHKLSLLFLPLCCRLLHDVISVQPIFTSESRSARFAVKDRF